MSPLARPAVRWSTLIALWALVGAVLWIVLVQSFLLALNPFCHLQRPSIARVQVKSVDRDPDSQITDFVSVRQGDSDRVLRLLKAEAAELHEYDEVWILGAWYADGLRPTEYRVSLQRVLLEYPVLLLLPAAWLLWRVRKARQVAEAAPPPPVRRTFTDDFHMKAQRFAKGTEAPDGSAPPEPSPTSDKNSN
ncbi:hypothetical protein [Geothrix sp. PMB-07]|uniref:hypothetical protein n=1 Tax=Geothrix sp. PMB-07 TaxID=3068640 RepID=UPI002741C488|nr:hypothetical protein [Geothrix sp. PMB-07]WLT30806.1 hypothetical protein Q9293_13880 [Geothrix sp. PMB-07]